MSNPARLMVSLVNRVLEPVLGLHLIQHDFLLVLARLAEIGEERRVKKLMYQKRLLELVHDLDGDIVECGVGWGCSLLYWALLAREEAKGRRIWGFDSFEGFPEPGPEDQGLKD